MILITGPLYSGKRTYAATLPGEKLVDAQERARGLERTDIPALAENLCRTYDVILVTEVGGGIVPADPEEREYRENAGRLSCELAKRATNVIRLCCGIPEPLKGGLPK
ncbi:MAG: bifunctional adenosylcobinamide kinase/adenosylcobinamide-phosphate guanylyltransferase [Acutalibacteraceae bacterium]|nr:bifunctional adenosylcobinamide kinase/adenosylcobinamide-phosphate guanylyltransferase [Acutalibacteraceae bacterium]